MYLSAGLKIENYIYLIECLSRSLISIHIPSGKAKIEAYLPWKYADNKIGMFSLNQNLFIYSPVIDHILIYNCVEQQMTTVELQGIKADEAGFYFSNVLIDEKADFIILPFKGKEIRKYGINGKLKFNDNQWYSSVSRKCGYSDKLFGNIRMDSACITGNQLFFSFACGNQNYLCKYEFDEYEHKCEIMYCSEDIAIRGVYAYSNIVLFRRIFSDKTEIVLITLDSDKQKTIILDYPATFEEDIYGDVCHLRVSLKKEILKIEGIDLKTHQKIYNFEYSDVYIENGILFNILKNEILIPDVSKTERYSIKQVMGEIKKCSFYKEGYRELFSGKYIYEFRYTLYNLIEYFSEFSHVMVETKKTKNIKSVGELIWEGINE